MNSVRLALIIILIVTFASCGSDNHETFELKITGPPRGQSVRVEYILTQDSLIVKLNSDFNNIPDSILLSLNVSSDDSVQHVRFIDSNKFDCSEQHALLGCEITFKDAGKSIQIDGNINHPKELDYFVRLVNEVVEEQYQLRYIDMQPAIEPDGKLEI